MRERDVAIVGMACRFPDAPDLGAYWRNLRSAKISFTDIPAERWDHSRFYHPGSREIDKAYARKLGLVDDIWSFPAMHYGMPPLRVKVTDPQHRLLIDTVRVALADAGCEGREFPRGETGVFVGASVSEHKDLITTRMRARQLLGGEFGRAPRMSAEQIDAVIEDVTPVRAFSIAGNLLNMIAATVAQTFDLGGPAFTIDAACSSSLVAAYEAVTYLRAGLCDVAVAGGVYLCLTPDNVVGFSRIGAISRSDACRPFDASADGFVLGEGVGAVVLKRLADALRDGDRIYAVVRGAGINNDGRGDGPMTPRREGQVAVLGRAYADAGLTPDTVGFVEAHGTATSVGDVVEVAALREHFENHGTGPIDCVLSSVKGNIGHTMSAAGIAGLIKAALVVSEGRLPPQAGFSSANPALGLGSDFRVLTEETPWAATGHPRRAGVSSFGFGGTNCHLVLEQAPGRDEIATGVAKFSERGHSPAVAGVGGSIPYSANLAPQPYPFLISAPTPKLLGQHLAAIRVALADAPDSHAPIGDLAFTLSVARRREATAVGFSACTREELATRLDEARAVVESGRSSRDIAYSAKPLAEADRRIAFLFPGQGAQAVDLGRALRDRFPRFRARLEELAAGIDDVLERPLLSILYPGDADREAAARDLVRTEVCQPAMAALGLALSDLLASFGVSPALTAGHSLGEFVAAGAAGLLAPGSALRFVAERGRVMRDLQLDDPGAMLAIAAPRATVEPHVRMTPGVVLANLNHPTQVVASGTTAGIDALVARLEAAGTSCTRLAVSHAFHSPLMAGTAPALRGLIDRLDLATPAVPVISAIEPRAYRDSADAHTIFCAHATAPVDFISAVEACAAAGARVFVQVGAGNALVAMARATLAGTGQAVATLSLATVDGDDTSRFCATLATLAALGVPVRLGGLFDTHARVAWLPATPLETEEYRAVARVERPPIATIETEEVHPVGSNGRNGRNGHRANEGHGAESNGGAQASAPSAPTPASDALVALFREQMAVFQQQNEIIRKQAELLGLGDKLPVSTVIAAPGPAPALAPAPQAATPQPPAVSPPAPTAPAARTESRPAAKPDDSDHDLEQRVCDLVAQVSAFPRASLQLDKRLVADLGFDSLMMVELASKAAEAFAGLGALPKSLFVNDPTVRMVAEHIARVTRTPALGLPASTGAIIRYRVTRSAAPLASLPAGAELPFAGPLAILADRRGVAALLAKLLVDAGRKVTIVDGEGISGEVGGVIDLRPLDGADDPRGATLAALELARDARRELLAVAHTGLAGAALAGFCKALAREWPGARVKSLGLEADADPATQARQIFADLAATDATVDVSFRAGVRQVPGLVAEPATSQPPAERVVVAISGGAHGIGRKLAVELARRHRARLILLGRSPDDGGAIAEIAGAGGEAHYFRADVADPAALSQALDAARRKVGPIELVIHAAGVIADAPVARKTDADAARVFDAKATGMRALLSATAGDPLRAFLVLSSWAGHFGSAAQTDYAAANAFTGALAISLPRPGVRVAALDLPPWDDTPMTRTMPAAVRAAMRAAGVPFLDDASGVEAVLAELSASGAGGELLLGPGEPPVERDDQLVFELSRSARPDLDDHQIHGRPVLPLAAAADLALAAARRAVGAGARLTSFDLVDGVRLESNTLRVEVRAHAQSGRGSVEIVTGEDRRVAYRGSLEALAPDAVALVELEVPAATEAPPLAVADFYRDHTFHGPRWQGIVSVAHLGDAHVAGVVRAGGIPHQVIDPRVVDASFQLAAYWAIVKHGRAGLPLGLAELRILGPMPPGAEIHCLLRLEKSQGDLFTGHVDYRDAQGTLVAQIRGVSAQLAAPAARRAQPAPPGLEIDPSAYDVAHFPEYKDLRQRLDLAKAMGIQNPYFNVHERVTNDTSVIDGREVINYSSYNYLGLSGDEDVNRATIAAIERYGTSVSASRIASGEKPLHRELEHALADFLGTEDSIVFVGGHATNVGTIGHLLGPGDLILHDGLAHDSILGGARLSGAKRRPFPHNDFRALDATLAEIRGQFKKVLIAVEGVYSMDGDITPLPEFIAVKKRHHAMLLVDEAHSLGVLGATGAGVGEHHQVRRGDVEFWMGTLSKSLASCGGYIAGSHATVEYLKYTMPGFVYSVGISPANSASALAALRKLRADASVVARLRERARFFVRLCRERGINTGMSDGSAVVPCIVGNSWLCLQLAQALNQRGINVQPILYPAVEEHLARLRFFMTARHSEAQLRFTVDAIAEELDKLDPTLRAKRKPSAGSPPADLQM